MAHVPHPHVRHPREHLPARDSAYDRFLVWVANHFLASKAVFTVFLVVPLLALPAPLWVKLTLSVITGGWMQSWGLNAIQFTQVRGDALRDAKADADHRAQTHIAHTVDEIKQGQDEIRASLATLATLAARPRKPPAAGSARR